MPIARINDVETSYEVEGEGTPVLFIHGGFGGAESTLLPRPSTYLGLLTPDCFRTITYDRRNAGRSGYVTRRFGVADLARDAATLLDHLDIERAIVVGDSLGGQIATQMALSWPHRVERLILCETGARIVRQTLKTRLALGAVAMLPARALVRLGRQRVLNPPFYDPLGPQTPDLLPNARRRHTEYKSALRRTPEDELVRLTMGILLNYAAFVGLNLGPHLTELAMPVTVLHGTADTVVSMNRGVELHRLIPQSELHLLPDLGHGLFYYEEARELLRDLLSGEGARTAAAISDMLAD